MRCLTLLGAALFCMPLFGFGQSADWGVIFREGASDSEATRERVRQKGETELLPRLTSESVTSAQIDANAIAEQLKSEIKDVCTQASGYLVLISLMRQDSADVLRPLFPILQNHFSDHDSIVASNSVRALGLLNPSIPEEQIHALADVIASNDQGFRMPALMGVARMVNKDGFAYETVDKIIAKHDALTASAIQALTATHSFNERLTRHIVPLLNSSNEVLMDATLTMIENLGSPVLTLSRDELALLGNDSSHQQLAERARRLLESGR